VAIYHLSVKTISRSAGRSATAAAAYRAGVEIVDVRTGLVHDYTHRSGVESSVVTLPPGAPVWAMDRSALWNAAEASELRKNSTVAREFEVALPAELSLDARRELVAVFAGELAARHGIAVDAAIHLPGKDGDHRNHHAHILTSTRRLGPEGFGEKARELDAKATGPALVTEWRARWAKLANAALEKAGRAERIDHRSLADQGIDRAPTVHLGPRATAMERAAARWSGRGEQNREIARANTERATALAEVVALQAERERREREAIAEAEARERARLAALPLPALHAEVRRLAPRSVDDLLLEQPAAQALTARLAAANQREQAAAAALARHTAGLGEWREASAWHRLQAWAHERGVVPHPKLAQAQQQVEQQTALQSAARAEAAAIKVEFVQAEPALRVAAEREHAAQVRQHALGETVLAERVAAEHARIAAEQEAVRQAQAVREEATAVASSLKIVAALRERGELESLSAPLAEALDHLDALEGPSWRPDQSTRLRDSLVAAPKALQKLGDWLEPHAEAIRREQARVQKQDRGMELG